MPCMHAGEKYVKKTTEKHTVRAMRAMLHRPTAPSMAETLFSWKPEGMRCRAPTHFVACLWAFRLSILHAGGVL